MGKGEEGTRFGSQVGSAYAYRPFNLPVEGQGEDWREGREGVQGEEVEELGECLIIMLYWFYIGNGYHGVLSSAEMNIGLLVTWHRGRRCTVACAIQKNRGKLPEPLVAEMTVCRSNAEFRSRKCHSVT